MIDSIHKYPLFPDLIENQRKSIEYFWEKGIHEELQSFCFIKSNEIEKNKLEIQQEPKVTLQNPESKLKNNNKVLKTRLFSGMQSKTKAIIPAFSGMIHRYFHSPLEEPKKSYKEESSVTSSPGDYVTNMNLSRAEVKKFSSRKQIKESKPTTLSPGSLFQSNFTLDRPPFFLNKVVGDALSTEQKSGISSPAGPNFILIYGSKYLLKRPHYSQEDAIKAQKTYSVGLYIPVVGGYIKQLGDYVTRSVHNFETSFSLSESTKQSGVSDEKKETALPPTTLIKKNGGQETTSVTRGNPRLPHLDTTSVTRGNPRLGHARGLNKKTLNNEKSRENGVRDGVTRRGGGASKPPLTGGNDYVSDVVSGDVVSFQKLTEGPFLPTWFYFGEIPLMTDRGSFIINGAPRVLVNQIVRCPGIYFKVKLDEKNRRTYIASFLSDYGSWLRIETDRLRPLFWVRIDKSPRFPLDLLFKSLGFGLHLAERRDRVSVPNLRDFGVTTSHLPPSVTPRGGYATSGAPQRLRHFEGQSRAGYKNQSNTNSKSRVSNSSQFLATELIWKKCNPGRWGSDTAYWTFLYTKFFNPKKYSIGSVGRLRLNKRFGRVPHTLLGLGAKPPSLNCQIPTLTPEDILLALDYLIELAGGGLSSEKQQNLLESNTKQDFENLKPILKSIKQTASPNFSSFYFLDDIDHLKNRRVRLPGEIIQNQFRLALNRVLNGPFPNLTGTGNGSEGVLETQTQVTSSPSSSRDGRLRHEAAFYSQIFGGSPPQAFVSTLRELFNTSQLSQYMDQTNPLAEITHKRRLSSLGPGGVGRDQAGFAVREIHPSHFGRICPIETPEGQNAGLVGSLASYARINQDGFLQSPARLCLRKTIPQNFHTIQGDEVTEQGRRLKPTQVTSSPVSRHGDGVNGVTPGNFIQKEWGLAFYENNRNLTQINTEVKEDISYLFSSEVEDLISLCTADIGQIIDSIDLFQDQAGTGTPEFQNYNLNRKNLKLEKPIKLTTRDKILYPSRYKQEFSPRNKERIQFQGISPVQLISVATSLIPFLEHDDANRALMGSNMQRQAVPLMIQEKPFVGTGLEIQAARDSSSLLIAPSSGQISYVDAKNLSLKIFKSSQGNPPELKHGPRIGDSISNRTTLRHAKVTSSRRFIKKRSRGLDWLVGVTPERGYATGVASNVTASRKGVTKLSQPPRETLSRNRGPVFRNLKFDLSFYLRSNQGTMIRQRPSVQMGEWVEKGELLADGSATKDGEIALGKNVLLAYMPWEGYNFEDAIVINERLVSEDIYSSIHIDRYEMDIKNLNWLPSLNNLSTFVPAVGKEYLTKNPLFWSNPNLQRTRDSREASKTGLGGANRVLSDSTRLKQRINESSEPISASIENNLDQEGIIQIGTWVQEGDILIGKITPIDGKRSSDSVLQRVTSNNNVFSERLDWGQPSSPNPPSERRSQEATPHSMRLRHAGGPTTSDYGGAASYVTKPGLDQEEVAEPPLTPRVSSGNPYPPERDYVTDPPTGGCPPGATLQGGKGGLERRGLETESLVSDTKDTHVSGDVVTNKQSNNLERNNDKVGDLIESRKSHEFFEKNQKTKISNSIGNPKSVNSPPEYKLLLAIFTGIGVARNSERERQAAPPPYGGQDIGQKLEFNQPDLLKKNGGLTVTQLPVEEDFTSQQQGNSTSLFTGLGVTTPHSSRDYVTDETRSREGPSINLPVLNELPEKFTIYDLKRSGPSNLHFKNSSFKVGIGIRGRIIDCIVPWREGLDDNRKAKNVSELLNSKGKSDNLVQIKNQFPTWKNSGREQKSTGKSWSDLVSKLPSSASPIAERPLVQKTKRNEAVLSTNTSLTRRNVLGSIQIFIAHKKRIQLGDKMSGRHGNKGIVSLILPPQDMPYLQDGTPVDVVLNPLGVPSRMNVGQVLETLFGLASKYLHQTYRLMPFDEMYQSKSSTRVYGPGTALNSKGQGGGGGASTNPQERRSHPTIHSNAEPQPVKDSQALNKYLKPEKLDKASSNRIEVSRNLVYSYLRQAKKAGGPGGDWLFDPNNPGKTQIFDGRTGEVYHQPVLVGYSYMFKLIHLVDDKIHARSTGPYSLVTQQPLGGRSKKGGQRLGEMEVWALEGFGAASILQEFLTIKSDEIYSRNSFLFNLMRRGGDLVSAQAPILRKKNRKIVVPIRSSSVSLVSQNNLPGETTSPTSGGGDGALQHLHLGLDSVWSQTRDNKLGQEIGVTASPNQAPYNFFIKRPLLNKKEWGPGGQETTWKAETNPLSEGDSLQNHSEAGFLAKKKQEFTKLKKLGSINQQVDPVGYFTPCSILINYPPESFRVLVNELQALCLSVYYNPDFRLSYPSLLGCDAIAGSLATKKFPSRVELSFIKGLR